MLGPLMQLDCPQINSMLQSLLGLFSSCFSHGPFDALYWVLGAWVYSLMSSSTIATLYTASSTPPQCWNCDTDVNLEKSSRGLPMNEELLWDNDIAFLEPCIDHIADTVGKVKDFMKVIDEQFQSSEKALARTLMSKLSSMRLIGVTVRHQVDPILEDPVEQHQTQNVQLPIEQHQTQDVEQPVEQQPEGVNVTLRRSTRIKKPAIPSDYQLYLKESQFDFGVENDPESFSQVINSGNSKLWSTSGYIFMMANGAISWRSAKQSLVATSTMEAEFISLFEATSQAKNNKSESRSKHIDIKYLVMRERVKANEMIIENISIELMIANPWTKGMQTKSVRDHVKSMELDSVI
ncbi:hypothetical protein D0Y65_000565 [Glycine soja]|uniref:Retrovirus-related Pol polyprotein from transposon TNT 1-94 n=1 Tax=Glycine soja TaxID=3848 RepID=A0A445LZD5_GLYSO|nr:hypothetical protein D0Y65_000565 [Glycine soja]